MKKPGVTSSPNGSFLDTENHISDKCLHEYSEHITNYKPLDGDVVQVNHAVIEMDDKINDVTVNQLL